MSDDVHVPEGYQPLFRTSPFLDLLGPIHYRERPGGGFTVGMRIQDKHLNARGTVHGGLYMALADVALGYSAAMSEDPPAPLSTASLTTDFAGSARLGDWIEAEVDIQRVGGRLAFANAYIMRDGERIVRASAVFARTG